MPPGPIAAIAWRAALLVAPSGAGREHDLHRVVEGDDAERVARVEPVDEREQRAPRGLEALAGHRAAAVEHHLHGAPGGAPSPARVGRPELEQHGQLVLLLHGHELDVQLRVQVHSSLLARVVLEGGSSPAGGDLTPLREIGAAQRADGREAAARADGRPEAGLAVGEGRAAARAAGRRAAGAPRGQLDDVVGEPEAAVARVAGVAGERGARRRAGRRRGSARRARSPAPSSRMTSRSAIATPARPRSWSSVLSGPLVASHGVQSTSRTRPRAIVTRKSGIVGEVAARPAGLTSWRGWRRSPSATSNRALLARQGLLEPLDAAAAGRARRRVRDPGAVRAVDVRRLVVAHARARARRT